MGHLEEEWQFAAMVGMGVADNHPVYSQRVEAAPPE